MLTYPFLDSPLLYIHSAHVPVKSLQSCPTLQPHARVACQAPLSMGFSKQDYWSGLPCPSPGDLSDPGIESVSPCLFNAPALKADSLLLSHQKSPIFIVHTIYTIDTDILVTHSLVKP